MCVQILTAFAFYFVLRGFEVLCPFLKGNKWGPSQQCWGLTMLTLVGPQSPEHRLSVREGDVVELSNLRVNMAARMETSCVEVCAMWNDILGLLVPEDLPHHAANTSRRMAQYGKLLDSAMGECISGYEHLMACAALLEAGVDPVGGTEELVAFADLCRFNTVPVLTAAALTSWSTLASPCPALGRLRAEVGPVVFSGPGVWGF